MLAGLPAREPAGAVYPHLTPIVSSWLDGMLLVVCQRFAALIAEFGTFSDDIAALRAELGYPFFSPAFRRIVTMKSLRVFTRQDTYDSRKTITSTLLL